MIGGKLSAARKAVPSALTVGFALVVWWSPMPAGAQSIGKATAVKNQVQGIRGGVTRTLGAGGPVFSNDRVKTGDKSLAQLLFLDQTTFSVAADSEAEMSRVYHPRVGTGRLVLNALVGAMRYVSGVLNPRNYEIRFPQGYLTVRGTIVDILAGGERSIIIVDQGAVTVHVVTGVCSAQTSYDVVAGKMLIVHSNCSVDGPVTMDATLMQNASNIPFPLYGVTQWPGQQQYPGQFPADVQSFDTRKDLNDIMNASRSSSGGNNGACPPGLVQYFFPNGTPYCSTP